MVENLRLIATEKFVMPAQAGIQVYSRRESKKAWIPAFAGMTDGEGVDFESG